MQSQPYEVLARFSDNQWHIHARELITLDDGTVIEGKPTPLAGLSDPAFVAIAATINATNVARIAELTKSLADKTKEWETLKTEKAALTTERDSLQEQVATLQSRINELTAEPDVAIVSRRQARLALLQMGLLETVEETVSQSPKAVQIEYEGDAWRRDNPTLVAMATALGMNEAAIDQFFALAGTL